MSWKESNLTKEIDAITGEITGIKGNYISYGLMAQFSVHRIPENPNGKGPVYEGRGSVSLLAPDDPHILLAEGNRLDDIVTKMARKEVEKRKEAGKTITDQKILEIQQMVRKELLVGRAIRRKATKDLKLTKFSLDKAKEAVVKAVEQLVVENYRSILSRMDRQGTGTQAQTVMRLYFRFAESLKYGKRAKRLLQKVCITLGEKRVEDLKKADVQKVVKKHGPEGFKIIRRFLDDYADEYQGDNPFRVHRLQANDEEREDKNNQARRKAGQSHLIEKETEKKLYQMCENDLEDGRCLVIALALGCFMSMQEMVALQWSDILFLSEGVFVRRFYPKDGGGLQNYTCPLLPMAQLLVRKRYEYLKSLGYSDKNLADMRVLTFGRDAKKNLKLSKGTDYLRDALRRVGVKYNIIQEYQEKAEKNVGGAGMRLCHDHVLNVLRRQCKIKAGSAMERYFRGLGMHGDTTNKAYRSFVGLGGRRTLAIIVNRDQRFITPQQCKIQIDQRDDNTETMNVLPGQPGKCLGVIIEVSLKKGDRVMLGSPCGLHASIGQA